MEYAPFFVHMFWKKKLPKTRIEPSRAAVEFKKKRAIRNLASGLKLQKRKTKLVLSNVLAKTFKSKIIQFLMLAVVLVTLILAGRYFVFSDRFDIKNIQVDGLRQLDSSDIDKDLAYLYGVNIFLIRSSTLKENVENASSYIKEVKVEKHLPDSISITISEREPKLVWVNLSGAYLVDTEGVVLNVILDYEDLLLDQEDVDLLKGYGNLSDIEEVDTDEKKKKDNKEKEDKKEKRELTTEEKQQIIETSRKEVISRVDQFWSKNLKNLGDQYKVYPFVYNYVSNNFMVLNNVDLTLMDASTSVINLDLEGEEVLRYVWESEYRFVLYLKNDRKIIFSTKRDLKEQLYDLEIFLADLKAKDRRFSYVDLSSDIIVYEFEE
ncbi:MAG: FtsQ-type POTRA domain-containing protein [Candidatus Dojkabacteria bacterium]|jgi:cell division septal protein FtsQ|nr:FtsQ-type POTRA domain-containing protein [Candidatus Dojkabacteria bacterium]